MALEGVLCAGSPAPLALIQRRLEVGEALGRVPESADQVPLQRDLEREAKRLRLKMSDVRTELDLDLRKDLDLDRSRFLHRLRLIGIRWGEPQRAGKGAGTFREGWRLTWDPEFAVRLIEASPTGTTVAASATAIARERAATAELPVLTELIEHAMLAHLPDALAPLLVAVDARGAASGDVGLLMEALGPLARVARYSDVRATDAAHVLPVVRALFARVLVALPPASTQIDDAAAGPLVTGVEQSHGACLLLDDAELREAWLDTLAALLRTDAVHPRVRGRACRLLLEQDRLGSPEVARAMSLALSQANEPSRAAQWIEGLIAGQALLLLHRQELLETLHAWLVGLPDEVFTAQLPLLRRAFASFSAAERRNVAHRVRRINAGGAGTASLQAPVALDPERAALVLPTLAHLLGVAYVD